MTAAAAVRPELFSHLIASQPEKPEKSLQSTLISLALHAVLITGAVWASANLKDAVVTPPDDVVTPVYIARQTAAATPRAPVQEGGAVRAGAAPRYEVPAAPISPGISPDFQPNPVPGFGGDPIPGPPAANPGPPAGEGGGTERGGFDVLKELPALLNRTEVQRALERGYPPLLRDARIGGTAVMWLLLNEQGRVISSEIKESSGQPSLDRAALGVAPLMRFSPARNRDQRVKVWVIVPLKFVA